MSRINNSYYAILGILSICPMSGYQIKSWVDDGIGYFWDLDYKQIYPTLKKLVEANLATFEKSKSGSRPESKVYRLTDQGMKELKEWLGKPVQDGKQSIPELLLKLFFGHHIPVETNIEHLKRLQAKTIAKMQEFDELSKNIEQEPVKDAFWHYRMTLVNRGKLFRSSELDWCDQTMTYLQTHLNDQYGN